MSKQITDTVLMIRPANFGFNPETATNNTFQSKIHGVSSSETAQLAIAEFENLVTKLTSVGIEVIVVEDTVLPRKTDAVFPNNWLSTHADGHIITYPMFSKNRRLERREDVIKMLQSKFNYNKRVQLETYEKDHLYLESTGSLILDRVNRLVYACKSIRTDENVLDDFCAKLNMQKILFDASDESGTAIYHTNVMMALGETFCVICLDAIKDPKQKNIVVHQLTSTDKDIINISFAQMNAFAGNMLQLKAKNGQTLLAMSESAYEALTTAQIKQLEDHTQLLHSPIPTIETNGGGSVRCMITEIFY